MLRTCNTSGMSPTKRRPEDVLRGAAFARLIVRARQEHGMSQDALAREAGINRSTILRWESGDATRPEPNALKDVCRVLGISQPAALHALGYLDETAGLVAA